jgi:hypothetical protein
MNQTLYYLWESNPESSGDADFKTLVLMNQGFFMPKNFFE